MAVIGISPGHLRWRSLAWGACNALQLVYTVAWTAGCISLALLVLLATGGNRRIPLRMAARLWAPGLLRGAGARLLVEGLERVDFSRPHVFVANHQSIIDVCALFRALPVPVRFVIKQEIAKVPFIGWYARAMGMVFIERGYAREAAERLHGVVSMVRAGASLCAFPEGTRSRESSLGPFKGGAFHVALLAGVPVVPIAISGSGEVLPPAGFRVRPGTIRVCIGEPIATAGLHPGARHALAQQAHDMVASISMQGFRSNPVPPPTSMNRMFTPVAAQWSTVRTITNHVPAARHGNATLPAPPLPGADGGWALFLDVDGTLLDFARHPDDVEVATQLHDDLARMRIRLQGAVALLSGRPLSQLDRLFDWRAHAAAGLHGAELRTPDGHEHIIGGEGTFPEVRAHAGRLLADVPEVVLEDKRRALALHYRHAPKGKLAAERIARTLLRDLGEDYVVQHGNQVIELKPAGVDKGRALEALMQVAPFHGRRPWMLGDDLTDEDAFRRVNALGGTSVIIGVRRPTAAQHALADPAAVRAWLHALAAT